MEQCPHCGAGEYTGGYECTVCHQREFILIEEYPVNISGSLMVAECSLICAEKTALGTMMFCPYLYEIRQDHVLCDKPKRRPNEI